jgi:hypothetical protein
MASISAVGLAESENSLAEGPNILTSPNAPWSLSSSW